MKNAIMKAAHEMTKETLHKYPGTNYRATFAAALRIAWEEAHAAAAQDAAIIRLTIAALLQHAADAVTRRAADVEQAVADLLDEMPRLSDDMPLSDALRLAAADKRAAQELAERLSRAAAAAPYRMLALRRYEEDDDGNKVLTYHTDARCYWMIPVAAGGMGLMDWSDAVQTVAGEAFIVLWDKVDGWADKTLRWSCYDAAAYAVARAEKCVRDRARRARKSADRADASYMENPDGIPGYHAPNPERLAIVRDEIDHLPACDNEKRIINGMMLGLTQTQMAAKYGLKQSYISKHLRSMMERAKTLADTYAAAAAK